MDFIEQYKHLLWDWDSWECILMKIIKGKWIFIMLFLTFVDSITWRVSVLLVLVWALYSDYSMVCFFLKAFLKSDTVVALKRSISLILWMTLASFINVYYEYFCKLMWLCANSRDVLEAKPNVNSRSTFARSRRNVKNFLYSP